MFEPVGTELLGPQEHLKELPLDLVLDVFGIISHTFELQVGPTDCNQVWLVFGSGGNGFDVPSRWGSALALVHIGGSGAASCSQGLEIHPEAKKHSSLLVMTFFSF